MILFGAPAITHAGRIVRFDLEDVRPPSMPTMRRRIIEYLEMCKAPSTARSIAQHLGLPHTAILEQLHYLLEVELIQKTGRHRDHRKNDQYLLIRYLQHA